MACAEGDLRDWARRGSVWAEPGGTRSTELALESGVWLDCGEVAEEGDGVRGGCWEDVDVAEEGGGGVDEPAVFTVWALPTVSKLAQSRSLALTEEEESVVVMVVVVVLLVVVDEPGVVGVEAPVEAEAAVPGVVAAVPGVVGPAVSLEGLELMELMPLVVVSVLKLWLRLLKVGAPPPPPAAVEEARQEGPSPDARRSL